MANERFLKNLGNSAKNPEVAKVKDDGVNSTNVNSEDNESLEVGFVLDGNNVPDEDDFEKEASQSDVKGLDGIHHVQVEGNFEKSQNHAVENDDVPNISAIQGLFGDAANQSNADVVVDPNNNSDVKKDDQKELQDSERRRPGPRPRRETPQETIDEEQRKDIEHDVKPVDGKKIDNIFSIRKNSSDVNVAEKVLSFVCKSTILGLIETYTSKIYTKEYAVQLMREYVEEKTDSQNPLFKQLILECINDNVVDPYLKEMTDVVLKYIMEN